MTFRLVNYKHTTGFCKQQAIILNVCIWAADQYLPYGFCNIHQDINLSDSNTLKLHNSCLWENQDPGENMRCGLIWHGVRPLCDYIINHMPLKNPRNIIELGAGMGIAGIVAALVTKSPTILSDGHPAVLKILDRNVVLNSNLHSLLINSELVRWDSVDVGRILTNSGGVGFDLILAGDVIYETEAVLPLLATVKRLLSRKPEAEFIMAHAERYPLLSTGGPVQDSHLQFMLHSAPRFGLNFTELSFTPQCEAEKLTKIFSFRHTKFL